MKEKHEKKARRFWVNPNSTRLNESTFHLEFQQLRKDEKMFFEKFRMAVSTFDELLHSVSSHISGRDTVMRLAVSPPEKLAWTLRYFGSGCSFNDLHKEFGLGLSTMSTIVRDVSSAVWQVLVKKYMPIPTEEYWLKIAEDFEKYSNFPHCIGAIDGKYLHTLKNSSIVLLAVADAKFRFIDISVGTDEKQTDTTVFERSSLWKKISNNSLHIPLPQPLSNTVDGKNIPYVFVGDKTIRYSDNILKPYSGKVTDQKRVFNCRLERARRKVECAYAILSNKWRIFQRPLNVAEELMINITKACCVLHNFVIQKEGYVFEDSLVVTGLCDVMVIDPSRGPRIAYETRKYLTEYFMIDGAVPWQNTNLKVNVNSNVENRIVDNDSVNNGDNDNYCGDNIICVSDPPVIEHDEAIEGIEIVKSEYIESEQIINEDNSLYDEFFDYLT